MSHRLVLPLAIFTLGLFTTNHIEACGDKFLLLGRSLKYRQTIAAAHPARVLLYTTAGSSAGQTDSNRQFAALLTLAGHTVKVADSPQSLSRALDSGRFDLIVVELADGPYVRQVIARQSGVSVVVPLIGKTTRADEAALKREYGVLLKKSAGPREAVSALDRALQSTRRSRS